MPQIELLDQQTIDKIAAGEVVDRPSSVVKELVENAIDAQATAVTVEIKEGGIALIRITDNGCGMEKSQVPLAFLRHSTSKIRSVEDLLRVSSLGFRGEALSSIAAVAQVELITKTCSGISGLRYVIEGGREVSSEEIGAPEGTTFLVRNLFYNTPARKKFLKTAPTEAGYISDLMEHMALSHPEVSFKFIANGQVKLHTSGNSNLKEVIYHIYGREIAANLLPIRREFASFSVEGFLGKPLISRGNRNYENYFINGRYVKSSLLAKSIEEGYRSFTMQHKYPFTVLQLSMPGDQIDVNVHPAKMELRFSNQEQIYEDLSGAIREAINESELVYQAGLTDRKREAKREQEEWNRQAKSAPEPFERNRLKQLQQSVHRDSPYEPKYQRQQAAELAAEPRASYHARQPLPQEGVQAAGSALPDAKQPLTSESVQAAGSVPPDARQPLTSESVQAAGSAQLDANQQLTTESVQAAGSPPPEHAGPRKLLAPESVKYHKIIGQVFDTYWLVLMEDKLYIIDQHAAHEKVLYERTMASLQNREYTSQAIFPPMLLSLSMQEEELLKKYQSYFEQLGFVIEPFGGREYAVTSMPANLFDINGQELMIELLDGLGEIRGKETPQILLEKVASMSCKAAVKGNQRLSQGELLALIEELLTLENPYHCPHGRPTIISMTRYELEKKFKRV